jgi:hypothetical protein
MALSAKIPTGTIKGFGVIQRADKDYLSVRELAYDVTVPN